MYYICYTCLYLFIPIWFRTGSSVCDECPERYHCPGEDPTSYTVCPKGRYCPAGTGEISRKRQLLKGPATCPESLSGGQNLRCLAGKVQLSLCVYVQAIENCGRSALALLLRGPFVRECVCVSVSNYVCMFVRVDGCVRACACVSMSVSVFVCVIDL